MVNGSVMKASSREAPASVGQRLLWLLDRRRTGAEAMNCPVLCRFDGPLDVDRLRRAVRAVVARHEALRTTVERRGRRIWQVVHARADVDLSIVHVAECDMQTEIARELRTRIDAEDSPVRATLWRMAPERHVFCLDVHHLASDAWSGAIQMRDLIAAYEQDCALLPPPSQYIDFTARQQEYFRGAQFERDVAYWRQRLRGGAYDVVPLGPLRDCRDTASARGTVDAETTAGLIDVARKGHTTFFAVMLSLCFATLHRMSGRTDISVASLFANRLDSAFSETAGFLANLLVLRCAAFRGTPFASLLHSVSAELRDAFVHQGAPLHLLPSELTARDGRRADEVVFQMLPRNLDRRRMGAVEVTMIAPDAIESRFELEATVIAEEDRRALLLFWNRARLDDGWAEEYLRQFGAIARSAAADPGWRL